MKISRVPISLRTIEIYYILKTPLLIFFMTTIKFRFHTTNDLIVGSSFILSGILSLIIYILIVKNIELPKQGSKNRLLIFLSALILNDIIFIILSFIIYSVKAYSINTNWPIITNLFFISLILFSKKARAYLK